MLAVHNWFVCIFSERDAVARPSVCLSVTFVHPTQPVEIFRNFSIRLLLGHQLTSTKILRRSSQGTPLSGELNARGVAKYSDFGPIENYISETVQDMR